MARFFSPFLFLPILFLHQPTLHIEIRNLAYLFVANIIITCWVVSHCANDASETCCLLISTFRNHVSQSLLLQVLTLCLADGYLVDATCYAMWLKPRKHSQYLPIFRWTPNYKGWWDIHNCLKGQITQLLHSLWLVLVMLTAYFLCLTIDFFNPWATVSCYILG